MRKVVTVLVLLLALGGPAFAGDIPNPPVVAPPPPPQKSASGDMLTPPAALIDALLSLLTAALP